MQPIVISAWNGFFGMFPPLILSFCFGSFHLPSGPSTPLVLLIGVLSYLGQTMMILALQVFLAILILIDGKRPSDSSMKSTLTKNGTADNAKTFLMSSYLKNHLFFKYI